ncbi:MAG TPA: outer membrane protein transport protein [Burkholderiaceae bacterium]|nr:outer membrane protein transport protein [Burkholderiaceae bacterium]
MKSIRYPFGARCLATAAAAAACAAAAPAFATNGYFSHGYGIKGSGMGGVSTALAQDSFGGANNPASMVWAGPRMDVGLTWFRPERDAERSGAGIPTLNGRVDSGSTDFFIPEFGYNAMINNALSLGVSVYGNGGLNTNYPQGGFNCGAGPANMLCGSGTLGVNMSQMIIAPTAAYKINERNSIGASVLIGYQRFKGYGMQAFDNAPGFPPFTSDPGHVTNNGTDTAWGAGLRIGWQGHVSDTVALGATFATKVYMSKFDKYRGLFAEQGDFDIPMNFGLGIAITPDSRWTIAADYARIYYSQIASVGNPSAPNPPAPLGADNGPGFGWHDINVFKLGVAYAMNEQWTLRAGINIGGNPIESQDVTINILAPGVVKNHYTAGFTYAPTKADEISAAFMYAARNSVSGSSMFNNVFPAPVAGSETISMREFSLGIAWARKF